ncbi:MAG: cytidylate kinase-like family protein [Gemmatimonadetes bacterium]|nr:cytidylate kinase-like family protein [Gemmatimonadota bacterium]
MPVITISRQLGAGGQAVATLLAEQLGWRLLDRALVERIAEELEVAPEDVEECDERVESFVERLGAYLAEGFPEVLPTPVLRPVSPERTARSVRRIVGALVEEEPAVVVGHGAQCILQGQPGTMHVFLHAPLHVRVARAMERYRIGEREATERIRRSDGDRKRYVREHFERDWLDACLYHLCLDTGSVGVEGAVDLIRATGRQILRGEGLGP